MKETTINTSDEEIIKRLKARHKRMEREYQVLNADNEETADEYWADQSLEFVDLFSRLTSKRDK